MTKPFLITPLPHALRKAPEHVLIMMCAAPQLSPRGIQNIRNELERRKKQENCAHSDKTSK